MKKITFFTLCLSALFSFSASARIWRVNNNPGINADFTTIQAAHDAAVVGDVILVEPSGTNYGDLIVTKKLIILGNGYFLDQNPNLQAYSITSQLYNVEFREGSDNSVFSGFSVYGIYIGSSGPGIAGVDIPLKNITVSRNNTSIIDVGTQYGSALNIIIKQNYVTIGGGNGGSGNGGILFDGGSGFALSGSINNNYCDFIRLDAKAFEKSSGAIISNNVIKGFVATLNSVVKNNIFISSLDDVGNIMVETSPSFPNTIANNIYASAIQPIGPGDQTNVDMSTVFVGATGNTTDSQWQLKAGSPAIGAGGNGEDCGMFGGTSPYILSGLPSVPSIYTLQAPLNSSTDALTVTISLKSNI